MKIKILKDLIKIIISNPLNINIILKDLLKIDAKFYSNHYHLQKGIIWLILAFNKTKDDGISFGYSLKSGWKPSYPETSGYIIPTLIEYYNMTHKNYIKQICKKIAEWLVSIQLENGGFQGGLIGEIIQPSIFNTGQIMFGLIAAYKEFDDEKYLDSLVKAGNFLVQNQENDGNWINYCYKNKPHTYNVRVSWALLELYRITKNAKYKNAAIKNLDWALTQQKNNYWFENNDPNIKSKPLLHYIAYTIRGFLESGLILENKNYIKTAFNVANKLSNYFEKHNKLPARFNSNWESTEYFTCLTGIAQINFIWFKFYDIYHNQKFLINALKLNNYLKSTQIINKHYKDVDGGIKGSDPIYGNYMRFTILNWAVKFFCDSLLLEKKIRGELNDND